MAESPCYQVNNTVYSKKLDERWVILSADKSQALELNRAASLLWESLQKPRTVESLVRRLTSVYSVDKKDAERDVKEFLLRYLTQGLIQQAPS